MISNVEARLANLCKSARLAGFYVREDGKTKAKIYTGKDHSAIWYLSINNEYIAVYEAGYRKFGSDEKEEIVDAINNSYVLSVKSGAFKQDIIDEVLSIIHNHFCEVYTSKSFPNYLEIYKPKAKGSLRNEFEDSMFMTEIYMEKKLQAKRKKEVKPMV